MNKCPKGLTIGPLPSVIDVKKYICHNKRELNEKAFVKVKDMCVIPVNLLTVERNEIQSSC